MQFHRIGDVTVLNDPAPVPGFGGAPALFLPVNAFVLHAEQPVVIDTGLSTSDKDFVSDLAQVLDPADVRWIWITHPDRDHTGGLLKLLQAAPQARLVTTFLGFGIMSTEWDLPLDRLYLLNPGEAGSICSIRARHSTSVIVGCNAFAHRCSTAPQPPASSTTGPARCSARTASGHPCRRLSWPPPPMYARLAMRFATFSCSGPRSIARGCTTSTRHDSVPPSILSALWELPRFSAATCRRCNSQTIGSTRPYCSRRRQTHSLGRTRRHSRHCSPRSSLSQQRR
jgi:Metallo-beta-lactamase superfamily